MSIELKLIIKNAQNELQSLGRERALRESWILAQYFLNKSQLDLLIDPQITIKREDHSKFHSAILELKAGKPLYRIIKERPFYGLNIKICPHCLEPREDSEIVVTAALEILNELYKIYDKVCFIDFATGSGALALAILQNSPNSHSLAIDISREALASARLNAQNLGLTARFTTQESDGFSNVKAVCPLIISNPPYIKSGDLSSLADNVIKYDPLIALDGGADGCDFYRLLSSKGKEHLSQNGIMLVEIGFGCENMVKEIFKAQNFRFLKSYLDLQKIPRALSFQKL